MDWCLTREVEPRCFEQGVKASLSAFFDGLTFDCFVAYSLQHANRVEGADGDIHFEMLLNDVTNTRNVFEFFVEDVMDDMAYIRFTNQYFS
jgi:hypothetical protein